MIHDSAVAESDFPPMNSAASFPAAPGIYCLMNLNSGRRGVGQSRNVLTRVRSHQRDLRLGRAHSPTLRADLLAHGPESFVFLLLESFDPAQSAGDWVLKRREGWWAQHLQCMSEQTGYNLEAGGVRSPASRFRDHERKLIKYRVTRYMFLPGVDLLDPVAIELLQSWDV